MSLRTEFVIKSVLEALDVLCRESDLSPRNEIINSTLGGLVKTLAATYEYSEEEAILADPRIAEARPKLLEKLSIAEAEMEKYWTDRFLQKDSLTVEDLKEFWYWNCYENLVDLEIACLPPAARDNGRGAVFVGAGALPLTAIILHMKTGMPVTCVDRDPEACAQAQALFEKLGLTDMRVIRADGQDLDYNNYATVFVASLVPDAAKKQIVKNVRNNTDKTFLAVRTAERLHALLYEPFEPGNDMMRGYSLSGKTPHSPLTINTTLVYSFAKAAEIAPQPPAAKGVPISAKKQADLVANDFHLQ